MTDKLLCPICGNENPRDAHFCQVCQTDLKSLPDELFTGLVSAEEQPAAEEMNEEKRDSSAEDSVIPKWLQERFKTKGEEPAHNDSFENYLGVLFSGAAAAERHEPEKAAEPEDIGLTINETQQNEEWDKKFADPAMIEEDDEDHVEDDGLYDDFSTYRPERKWDDQEIVTGGAREAKTTKERTEGSFVQSADEWEQKFADPAMIEEDDEDHVEDDGLYDDFSTYRPERKWDDPEIVMGGAKNAETTEEQPDVSPVKADDEWDKKFADPAMIEEDDEDHVEDDGLYDDFSTYRPERKWDDPDTLTVGTKDADTTKKQPSTLQALPIEDPYEKYAAPLFELDDSDGEKVTEEIQTRDGSFDISISLAKTAEGAALVGLNDAGNDEKKEKSVGTPLQTVLPISGTGELANTGYDDITEVFSATDQSNQITEDAATEYESFLQLDEGNLISDFIRDFSSEKETTETIEPEPENTGTTFFGGSDEPQMNVKDDGTGLTDADVLNELLLNQGYHVETEDQITESVEEAQAEYATDASADLLPSNETSDESDDEITSVALPEETGVEFQNDDVAEVQEDLDQIPWNLFEAGEMSLPGVAAPTAYKTFSRTGLPEGSGETDYQQRMVSNLLDKILQIEGRNLPSDKSKKRKDGRVGQIICAILAIIGVLVILLTGVTDSIHLERRSSSMAVQSFIGAVEAASGDVLVVIDYSPAYSDELDPAVIKLLHSLSEKDCSLTLAATDPSAMSVISRFSQQYSEIVGESLFLPGEAIAIQELNYQKERATNVFLISADSGSIRNWAEQLHFSLNDVPLNVLASAQVTALLSVWTDSGLIDNAISTLDEKMEYSDVKGKDFTETRPLFAVWFLIIYAILVWLVGCVVVFMSNDPGYARLPKSISSDAASHYGKIPTNSMESTGREKTAGRKGREDNR